MGHPELSALYGDAIRVMSKDTFVRNHRRVLKDFYFGLRLQTQTHDQMLVVEPLESQRRRTQISIGIHDRVISSNYVHEEEVGYPPERKSADRSLLGPTAYGAAIDTRGKAFHRESKMLVSGIVDTSEASEDSFEDDRDVRQLFETRVWNCYRPSTTRFLTSGQAFILYKESIGRMSYPAQEEDREDLPAVIGNHINERNGQFRHPAFPSDRKHSNFWW